MKNKKKQFENSQFAEVKAGEAIFHHPLPCMVPVPTHPPNQEEHL
jgi:hypothetical protein